MKSIAVEKQRIYFSVLEYDDETLDEKFPSVIPLYMLMK